MMKSVLVLIGLALLCVSVIRPIDGRAAHKKHAKPLRQHTPDVKSKHTNVDLSHDSPDPFGHHDEPQPSPTPEFLKNIFEKTIGSTLGNAKLQLGNPYKKNATVWKMVKTLVSGTKELIGHQVNLKTTKERDYIELVYESEPLADVIDFLYSHECWDVTLELAFGSEEDLESADNDVNVEECEEWSENDCNMWALTFYYFYRNFWKTFWEDYENLQCSGTSDEDEFDVDHEMLNHAFGVFYVLDEINQGEWDDDWNYCGFFQYISALYFKHFVFYYFDVLPHELQSGIYQLYFEHVFSGGSEATDFDDYQESFLEVGRADKLVERDSDVVPDQLLHKSDTSHHHVLHKSDNSATQVLHKSDSANQVLHKSDASANQVLHKSDDTANQVLHKSDDSANQVLHKKDPSPTAATEDASESQDMNDLINYLESTLGGELPKNIVNIHKKKVANLKNGNIQEAVELALGAEGLVGDVHQESAAERKPASRRDFMDILQQGPQLTDVMYFIFENICWDLATTIEQSYAVFDSSIEPIPPEWSDNDCEVWSQVMYYFLHNVWEDFWEDFERYPCGLYQTEGSVGIENYLEDDPYDVYTILVFGAYDHLDEDWNNCVFFHLMAEVFFEHFFDFYFDTLPPLIQDLFLEYGFSDRDNVAYVETESDSYSNNAINPGLSRNQIHDKTRKQSTSSLMDVLRKLKKQQN